MGCGATFVYCRVMYCKSERERAKNLGRMTGNEWERKNVRNRMRTKIKLTKKRKKREKRERSKMQILGNEDRFKKHQNKNEKTKNWLNSLGTNDPTVITIAV